MFLKACVSNVLLSFDVEIQFECPGLRAQCEGLGILIGLGFEVSGVGV